MVTFGEKLRRQRESHGASIEQVSEATEIGQNYLEALERNEFASLPGSAIGKFYIRAYAELLGFDPAPLIADYDRELRGGTTAARPSGGDAVPSGPGSRTRDGATESRREKFARVVGSAAPPSNGRPKPAEPEPRRSTGASERRTPVVPVPSPEPRPAAAPKPVEPAAERQVLPLVLGAVLFAGIAWVVWSSRGAGPVVTVPDVAEPEMPIATSFPSDTEPRTSAVLEILDDVEPEDAPTVPEAPTDAGPRPSVPVPDVRPPEGPGSEISVLDFAVGRRLVDRQVREPGDRFEAGSSVWFATRVIGAEPGQILDHVWMHRGRVVESIELKLGGAHWRTNSRKTVWAEGPWTVEARDASGRVLARASFTCVPPGRKR